jgi:hypothetical protein
MRLKIFVYIFVIQILLSCSSRPTPIPDRVFDMPELKDHYQALMQEAQSWSPDAYLHEIYIPIGQKSSVLEAEFYSPTENNQSLEISIDVDGKLTKRKFRYELGVLQQTPILRNEWEVGSQDALRILIGENKDSIQSLDAICGSLVLTRVKSLPNQPLLWILNYSDCSVLTYNHSYLDPITGKVVMPK